MSLSKEGVHTGALLCILGKGFLAFVGEKIRGRSFYKGRISKTWGCIS